MRLALAVLVAASALLLSGCSGGGDACSDLPGQRAVVEATHGRDATVRLADGEPAVLHLPDAVFRQGGGCARVGAEAVQVGDPLAFEVDAWAESYPVQGWPERVVILQ
jgi:hypothetical protein